MSLLKYVISLFYKPSEEDIYNVCVIEGAVKSGLRIENTPHGGFLITRESKLNRGIHENNS